MSEITKIEAEISKIWEWLKSVVLEAEHTSIPIAVAWVQHLKQGLESKEVLFLANAIDAAEKTGIAVEVLGLLERWTIRTLAILFAIESPPDNATPAEIEAFATTVLNAFGVHPDKSEIYSGIFGKVSQQIGAYNSEPIHTWIDRLDLGEEFYTDLKEVL